MRASSLVLVALALCAAVSVQAQAPIPYRPDGWQIGGPLTAPIVIDVHVDVLCPDCAAAWPTVKQLIGYYGQKLAVSLHTFPLPYHTYGFMAAQATHVAVDGGASPVAVADFIFGAQSAFWNDATFNKTAAEVQAALGSQLVGAKFLSQSAFAAGMSNANINEEVRVSWKYACSRGVLGTPTFFVNGVTLAADPSWTLKDWQSILDPLLAPQPSDKAVVPTAPVAPQRKHRSVHRHAAAAAAPARTGCVQRSAASRRFVAQAQTCPAGEPTCTYLPGKVECCFAGESCIPNVGCRC